MAGPPPTDDISLDPVTNGTNETHGVDEGADGDYDNGEDDDIDSVVDEQIRVLEDACRRMSESC